LVTERSSEQASSEIYSTLLMVIITVILAAMLMIWCLPLLSFWPPGSSEEVPTIFEITGIYHHENNKPTKINLDSRIILKNSGDEKYENDLLKAEIYCNKIKIPCSVDTFNGYEFIRSHHFGVQTLSGIGCEGKYWRPYEKLCLDLTDKTIRPGDLVRVDIIYKPTDKVISSDNYRA